jgi:hypothetical protein
MKYKLYLTWIFSIWLVIGILIIPTAEADKTTLRLELSHETTYAVPPGYSNLPASEVEVDLIINPGSYANNDNVDSVQITIEYDSSVATVEEPFEDNIWVDADLFGITMDAFNWKLEAGITGEGDIKQLTITMFNRLSPSGTHLQEPTGDFPAVFMKITFTAQTYLVAKSAELNFIDNETFFVSGDIPYPKLLLLEGINGNISFIDTPSDKVALSLPSVVVYPPVIGETVQIPVTIKDGYISEDLITFVVVTIAYDSTVVDIGDGTTPVLGVDVIPHPNQFGTDLGDWDYGADIRTDLAPPEHPELDKQVILQIGSQDEAATVLYEPTNGFPEDIWTIKFTVKSDNPQDKTLLFYINDQYSYFGKRDTPKQLSVDPIHGDIALPVELSALGAIWNPNGNKIFWEAKSQRENLGWNIYRSETKDGKYVKINGELIKGAGTTANPMKYSFIDKDAEKGKIYYYYLEDISFNGDKHRTNSIRSIPVNKITSWGDIKRSTLR